MKAREVDVGGVVREEQEQRSPEGQAERASAPEEVERAYLEEKG